MKDYYFKGDRVIHVNHGSGVVTADQTFPDEVFVRFDSEPDGWTGNELCVSYACLRKE